MNPPDDADAGNPNDDDDMNDRLDDETDADASQAQSADFAADSAAEQGAAADSTSPDEQVHLLNDRVLRLTAELDNVRKRASRETSEARLYAAAPLLVDLLSVLDNMQRAVAAAQESSDAKNLVDGFGMVAQLLQDVLARHGCTKIEAAGQPFDPHLHEAIGQQPSADVPPGSVLFVVQDGYQLHDRVLRPTRVMIAAAPAEPQ